MSNKLSAEELAEARPCPFCDSRDLEFEHADEDALQQWQAQAVVCCGCRAQGATAELDPDEFRRLAIGAWNRRAREQR